jgi:lysophospholipase L1-like esterase
MTDTYVITVVFSPVLVSHTSSQTGTASPNNITSSAINTTGATLLLVGAFSYTAVVPYTGGTAASVTDSKGNLWTALEQFGVASSGICTLFYCPAPIVGTNHTFTITVANGEYVGISAAAFSGITQPTIAVSGNNATSATTLQPGSLAGPSGSLFFSLYESGTQTDSTESIDSGFAILDQNLVGIAIAHAYLVGTGTAVNPTWATVHPFFKVASMAAFSAPEIILNLASEGDSITDPTHAGQPNYAVLMDEEFAVDGPTNIFAITGSTITTLTSRQAVDNRQLVSGVTNILTVLIGRNDMGSDDLNESASTFISNLSTYCQTMQTAGWKVVIATVLPSTLAGFNSVRDVANTLIRSGYTAYASALADIASDPTMGPDSAAANTTYYIDGTHPTSTGQALLAPYFEAAVNGLL